MASKKIFLSDLDGTLLTDDKKISPKTRESLDRFIAAGNCFAICTGRPTGSALHCRQELSLPMEDTYIVSFNGAHIMDNHDNVIYKETMDLEDIPRIYEIMESHGVHCLCYNDTDIITKEMNECVDFYCIHIKMPVKVIDSLSEITEPPCKLLGVHLSDTSKLEEVRDALNAEFGDKYISFLSTDTYVEIISNKTSKGMAAQMLAKHFNVPIGHVMTAGDAENDISMLEVPGIHSVAMVNGAENVKAISATVTELDNNHDGLAPYIDEFCDME